MTRPRTPRSRHGDVGPGNLNQRRRHRHPWDVFTGESETRRPSEPCWTTSGPLIPITHTLGVCLSVYPPHPPHLRHPTRGHQPLLPNSVSVLPRLPTGLYQRLPGKTCRNPTPIGSLEILSSVRVGPDLEHQLHRRSRNRQGIRIPTPRPPVVRHMGCTPFSRKCRSPRSTTLVILASVRPSSRHPDPSPPLATRSTRHRGSFLRDVPHLPSTVRVRLEVTRCDSQSPER